VGLGALRTTGCAMVGNEAQPKKEIIMRRKVPLISLLALLSLPIALLVAPGGATAASVTKTAATPASAVKSSSLGQFPPTFVGPAGTGCISVGCDLLTGPFPAPSTASLKPAAAGPAARQLPETPSHPQALPMPALARRGHADPVIPTVSCQPLGPGCDKIGRSAGGAVGVKGLNAVDSGTLSTNILLPRDIEPPDQGLCAGNGYVVEDNNIGEILIFNKNLQRKSAVIPLDTLMGLTTLGYSSGGDISCAYDYSNGGHWFFTEIVSANSELAGGPFTGCFAGVALRCMEGIAVTVGNNPFGPYNVYFAHADYNPAEPGYPSLLNDFGKIAVTRDAFLYFYDEFPLNPAVTPGIGGGLFNGAQELAFDKNALERGLPVTLANGSPNPAFNVAVENMGLLPTPDGTCSSDNQFHLPGIACWSAVIPAMPPDPTQFDSSHGGSGFMLATLDFNSFAGAPSAGANKVAVFDWTGLRNLDSTACVTCTRVRFGGQIFSHVLSYYGVGNLGAQKKGPIPLGDECGPAGLSVAVGTTPAPASCPENGIATNGDFMTQVSQAQGQLWGGTSTEINQTYSSQSSPELHQGAVYWVIGTGTFDKYGVFSLTSQGYVSPKHEDLEFPAMAAEGYAYQDGGDGGAIMDFTLSGNGGPTHADNGGFYPSTAYGRVSSRSSGLLGSVVNVADLGQSPQDGFTEYLFYPTANVRPRWGDYSNAIFLPGSGGKIYFATNYIQYPNCLPPAFTLTLATCGGTRDGLANWGTSVNSVIP
jgi:hypothetical protein